MTRLFDLKMADSLSSTLGSRRLLIIIMILTSYFMTITLEGIVVPLEPSLMEEHGKRSSVRSVMLIEVVEQQIEGVPFVLHPPAAVHLSTWKIIAIVEVGHWHFPKTTVRSC